MYCTECGSELPVNNNICPNCGHMTAPAKQRVGTGFCVSAAATAAFGLVLLIVYYLIVFGIIYPGGAVIFIGGGTRETILTILNVLLVAAVVAGFALLGKAPVVLGIASIADASLRLIQSVITLIRLSSIGGTTLRYLILRSVGVLFYVGIVLIVLAIFLKNDMKRGLAIAGTVSFGILILSSFGNFNVLFYGMGGGYKFTLLSTASGLFINLAYVIAGIGLSVAYSSQKDPYRKY